MNDEAGTAPHHVAIVCHDLRSRLNTSLELADRLARGGHRVTFVTHADVGPLVAGHGHDLRRLTGPAAHTGRLTFPGPRHPFRAMSDARRLRATTAGDGELESAIEKLDPDIILVDIEMHYATIVLSGSDRPVVLYMNWFSIFRGRDIPPLDSSFVPSASRTDALGIRRAWFRSRAALWGRRVRRRLGRAAVGDLLRPISYSTYHHADLRYVARVRGIRLRDLGTRRHWLQPITFTHLPILSFTASEMEFPHDAHPALRYVGPMIAEQRIEPSTERASVVAWEDLVAHRRASDSPNPLIYCSLGSYLTDIGFLRRVLDTFRERAGWHLVLGLGGRVEPGELGTVPDNVTVLEWAPQLDVLSEADAAIIHGGSSSVHECVSSAVPMLVYPPDRRDLDQFGNAARVVGGGLGLVGAWRSDGPAEMGSHLERLLHDDSFRLRLQSMRDVFTSYVARDVAVSTIMSELALHRSSA